MSDSPIFDQLNAERDYTGKMEVLRNRTKPFRTIGMAGSLPLSEFLQEVHEIADRTLGVEEEPEVLAEPFVTVEGEPRGKKTSDHPHDGDTGIRGLLEHVGIDTSGGISVGDRVVAEPLMAKVIRPHPQLVMNQLEGHYPEEFVIPSKKVEYAAIEEEYLAENFDPGDLQEQGVGFTEYVAYVIDKFKTQYPHVNNGISLSTKHELDGTETIVVKAVRPHPENNVPEENTVNVATAFSSVEGGPRDVVNLIGVTPEEGGSGLDPLELSRSSMHENVGAELRGEPQHA
jgi:hypothetical protein